MLPKAPPTRRAVGPLVVAAATLIACARNGSVAPTAQAAQVPAAVGPAIAGEEVAFDARAGLGAGWADLGWAPRQIAPGQPARLDLADRAGWILSRKGLSGSFGVLQVRFQAPPEYGDFLEVKLDSSRPGGFPSVPIGRDLQRTVVAGWTDAEIPLGTLDPRGLPFDRVVLRARADVGHRPVLVQRIALRPPAAGGTAVTVNPGAPATAATPPRTAATGRTGRFLIDCRVPARPISPLIYGTGGGDDTAHAMGVSTVRWGGNPTTRYNWELGNAWNVGSDWFFRNVQMNNEPGYTYDRNLQANLDRGLATALTVPTIGWVAKDTTSYGFPVSEFGPQQAIAPENADIGNGKTQAGTPLPPGPPTRTSVEAPPAFIGKWLTVIKEKDKVRGRSVHTVILDNEPMLWHETHRDVRPRPLGYDELLRRSIDYATAVRKAYPEVRIAGPAEWGWTSYFYSAIDTHAGVGNAPDRRAHGNVPLIPWWLHRMRAHEKKARIRLLDLLDVHYYPQGNNIGVEAGGATDPATNALRIRSTRSLWDPYYHDESWINDRVELIPRLRRWVNENAPGLGIQLGEYSFGAAGHMSGGLAQAEALGRFGTEGLTAAYYWFLPPKDSPVFWAFRAFRNYDGQGARFLDLSVPVVVQAEQASLFVSRSEAGDKLVAVLLNFDPQQPLSAELDLSSCGAPQGERAFVYTGGKGGFTAGARSQASGTVVRRSAAPYSITVLEWKKN